MNKMLEKIEKETKVIAHDECIKQLETQKTGHADECKKK